MSWASHYILAIALRVTKVNLRQLHSTIEQVAGVQLLQSQTITRLAATVPVTTGANAISNVTLTAVSNFSNAQSDTNTDVIHVVDGPNINVSKSIGEQVGLSPSGNYLVTLDYVNSGNGNAVDVAFYTFYQPSAACTRTPCWVTEPEIDTTGTINAETDQLLPGDTFALQFSVRVQ